MNTIIHSANTLEDAGPGQISFLANPKYIKQLETNRASAVVVSLHAKTTTTVALLKAKDPYYAFTKAVVKLHGYRRHPIKGIHPSAYIDPTATIGENTIVYPGVYVGPGTKVGRDCILHPNVVIYEDVVIGDRVIINACACIGQDGFGFATHGGVQHKIPQTATVIIEDDCEIGACTCIDRGALANTVIGKGSKLSNLIAFGHGSTLGEHSLIVGQVGIAGSVKIGHHVTMAGQVGRCRAFENRQQRDRSRPERHHGRSPRARHLHRCPGHAGPAGPPGLFNFHAASGSAQSY